MNRREFLHLAGLSAFYGAAIFSGCAPSIERTTTSTFGYGDTEVGVKYRFFEETDQLPQMGVFPLVEMPSGSRERNLQRACSTFFSAMAAEELWLLDNLRRRRVLDQPRQGQSRLVVYRLAFAA
jgi:hypothetical protein